MSLTIREEQFLAKIAGEDVTTPEPLTREERFLAKIAGEDVTTPEPLTKEEQLLDKIASSGGGGGGVDLAVVTLDIYTNNIIYLRCVYDYNPDGSTTFPLTMEGNTYLINGNEDDEPYTISVQKEEAISFGSGTVTLPLMGDTHSYCMYGYLPNVTVTLSGAVTDDPIEDTHVFTITGDCTITFR